MDDSLSGLPEFHTLLGPSALVLADDLSGVPEVFAETLGADMDFDHKRALALNGWPTFMESLGYRPTFATDTECAAALMRAEEESGLAWAA